MIYAGFIGAGIIGLLLWLYARAIKKCGELKVKNEALQAEIKRMDEQARIAADPGIDPADIVNKLRNGGL